MENQNFPPKVSTVAQDKSNADQMLKAFDKSKHPVVQIRVYNPDTKEYVFIAMETRFCAGDLTQLLKRSSERMAKQIDKDEQ